MSNKYTYNQGKFTYKIQQIMVTKRGRGEKTKFSAVSTRSIKLPTPDHPIASHKCFFLSSKYQRMKVMEFVNKYPKNHNLEND